MERARVDWLLSGWGFGLAVGGAEEEGEVEWMKVEGKVGERTEGRGGCGEERRGKSARNKREHGEGRWRTCFELEVLERNTSSRRERSVSCNFWTSCSRWRMRSSVEGASARERVTSSVRLCVRSDKDGRGKGRGRGNKSARA